MSTTIKIKKSQTIETAAMWQNIIFGFVHTLREAAVYPTIQPISIMTPPLLFLFFRTFKLKVSKKCKDDHVIKLHLLYRPPDIWAGYFFDKYFWT